jgi:aldose 1-epimerase
MNRALKGVGVTAIFAAILSCNNSDGGRKEDTLNDSSATHFMAPKENFDDVLNGKKVSIYFLKNKDISASITNYGGRVVNLLVPDKNGKMIDVAIGFDSYKGFRDSKEPYFGALIGRYGNRIAKGKFSLDGVTYKLPLNNGPNTLHGGPGGFHNVVWDATQLSDSSLQLSYLSKDDEQSFPGNLNVKVIYTLTSNREMKIGYGATTDKKTVVNLTNHTFSNLNGEGTINDHQLMIIN